MILVISVQLTGKRYTNEFGTDDVTALLTYSKPDDDPFPPFLLRHLRSPPHSHSLVSLRILILRHEISSWSILSILCSKSKIIYRIDEKIQRKSSLEKDEIPALSLSLSLSLRCELSSRPRKYENKYVCRRRRRGGLEMKLK